MRVLLSLAVAALLLFALARWGGIGPRELAATLGRLTAGAWAWALGLHLGIYLLRAQRFRQLVPPRTRPGFGAIFAIGAAHNLAAYVLPAKTGELSFVVYMKALCGVPASEGLASLLVSRLLDLAVLTGGIGLASLAIASTGGDGDERAWLWPLGGALVALSGLLGLFCKRSDLLVLLLARLVRALRLDRVRLGAAALGRAEALAHALREASERGRLAYAALLSLPLWAGVFLFYAVLARDLGIGERGNLAEVAFGSGLATVSNLLPINGFAGFGTQEAGWAIGFRLLGVPPDVALATGVGVHIVQLFNVVLMGLLGQLALGWIGRRAGR